MMNLTKRWAVTGDHASVAAFEPSKGEELKACPDCGEALQDHGTIADNELASRLCPGDIVIGGGGLRAWPLKDVVFIPVEELAP